VLPGPKDLCRKHPHPFVLLAATSSPRDPKVTALTVAIPDCCLDLVPALSSGQWRPVLFGAVKPDRSTGVQSTLEIPPAQKIQRRR